MKRSFLSALVIAVNLAAFGRTYTWTGNAGGEWNKGGNWKYTYGSSTYIPSGTLSPTASDTLSISAATEAKPFLVTANATIASKISLGAGMQVFTNGAANVVLRLTGVISGSGGIAFYSQAGGSYLRLDAANTFSGGVNRIGSGQVQLYHVSGLGSGDFTMINGANGEDSIRPALAFYVKGTFANNMNFATEANNKFRGSIQMSTTEAHITGDVVFAGETRINMNSNSKLYFDGFVRALGRITLNSNAEIHFMRPVGGLVDLNDYAAGYLHTDQCNGKFYLHSYKNAIKQVYFGSSGGDGAAAVYLGAENALPGYAFIEFNASSSTTKHNYTVDLCGYNETIESAFDDKQMLSTHYITSAYPATITMTSMQDRSFGGCFTDMVSLDWASTSNCTYTLSGGVHTTSGKFRVSKGTLKLLSGSQANSLSEVEIAPGATVIVDQFSSLSADVLTIEKSKTDTGKIQLDGNSLSFGSVIVNGKVLPNGKYDVGELDWATGEGSIVVATSGNVYTWTGNSDGGEWNSPKNWLFNGKVPDVVPNDRSTLYFEGDALEKPFRVSKGTTISNSLYLASGTLQVEFSGDGEMLDFNGKITGEGGLRFNSVTNARYYARLSNGKNAYEGGTRRSGAGQIQVMEDGALGSGPVVLDNGSALNSGIANYAPMYFGCDCTVPNDITVGTESYVSWNGWCTGKANVKVKITGDVSFSGQTRYSNSPSVDYAGQVKMNGEHVIKGSATLYFRNAIKPNGSKANLFTDNDSATVHLCASSNQVKTVKMFTSGGNTLKYFLEAEDALAGVEIYSGYAGWATIDLCGNFQSVAALYFDKPLVDRFTVTSESTATLRIDATKDLLFGGHFAGMASLDWSPKGDYTYTLSNGVHTTAGKFRASRGKIAFVGGAKADELSALEIAPGATVSISSDALVSAEQLVVESSGANTGKLVIGGKSVDFGEIITNGAAVANGLYDAGDFDWVEGTGKISVGLGRDVFVWTGEAGGEWNEPGNWLVNGEIPAEGPGASQNTLYIDSEKVDKPFVVSKNTEVPNDVFLVAGERLVTFANAETYVNFSGRISGAGSLRFIGETNATYSARFSHVDNTFTGGVRRSGAGEIRLMADGALGLGPIVLDNGSANGSGISNKTPLYIGCDCTIPNDVSVGRESYQSWNGWCSGASGAKAKFTGSVTFNGQTRYAAKITVDYCGPVSFGTTESHVCKGSATVYFRNKITASKKNGSLYTDNDYFYGHLCASSNEVKSIDIYSSSSGTYGDVRYYLEAEDAIAGANIGYGNRGGNGATLDLCGYAQSVESLYYKQPIISNFKVTSAAPATLRVDAKQDLFFGGYFDGAASLNWNPVGNYTYTLSNGVHTTTGRFRASKGKISFVAGSQAKSLFGLEVAPGAAIELSEDSSLSAEHLIIEKDGSSVGKLMISGNCLAFGAVDVNGELLPRGVYDASEFDWVEGDGKIAVGLGEEVYVWTGAAGGEWNTLGNWLVNGKEPINPPGSGRSTLYIDAAADKPFVVSQSTTISNDIYLAGGERLIQLGPDEVTVDFVGRIYGPGGLRFDSVDNAFYYVGLLNGDNDFEGGVRRSGAGQVRLMAEGAFGTGPIVLDNGSENGSGITNATPFYVGCNCTIPNDITVGHESFVSWNGWCSGVTGITAKFTGDVEFKGQVRCTAAITLDFVNPVKMTGTHVCKSGSTVYFRQPIQKSGSGVTMLTDNGNYEGHFCASSNQVSEVYLFYDSSYNKVNYYLEAPDALAGAKVKYNNNTSSGVMFDLCGKAQSVAGFEYLKPLNRNFCICSELPATLRIDGDHDQMFGGCFTGRTSLVWAPKGNYTYALSNGVHTTTGKFRVAGGSLRLTGGVSALSLSTLEVAPNATLAIDASAGEITSHVLHVEGVQGNCGTMQIEAGYELEVGFAVVCGRGLVAGTYTSSNCDWVTGGGKVVVLGDSYTWTGAAGGEWNTPGNWKLGNSVATAEPAETAMLYIGDAFSGREFRTDKSSVAIPNDIFLGEGEQNVLFSVDESSMMFNGTVRGRGGFKFNSIGTARYYAKLSGIGNDFEGGVRRSGRGQLQVDQDFALGYGPVTLEDGGGSGATEFYYTPLYVIGEVTLVNDLFVGKESYKSWNGWLSSASKAVVHFAGDVNFTYASGVQTRFASGVTAYFDGVVRLRGKLYCKAGASLYFKQPIQPYAGTLGTLISDNGSIYAHLRAPDNSVGAIQGESVSSWYWYLEAENAIPEVVVIVNGAASMTLDLCGKSQTVRDLYYTEKGSGHSCAITSANPAELTVRAISGRTFLGVFTGAASLVYDPIGDFTYVLKGANHTTTGGITVKRGTVILDGETSFSCLSAIEIASGATLKIEDGASINTWMERITLADDANFDVADGTVLYTHHYETVDKTGVKTVYPAGGSYKRGGITINTYEMSNWTGQGADTKMSTQNNWDSPVDFTSGKWVEVFAKGGSVATADRDMNALGYVFDVARPFTINGTGTISLLGGGITVENTYTNTIAAPLAIGANGQWRLGTGSYLNLTGDLNGNGNVEVLGSGTLLLNSKSGDFSGDVIIRGGNTYVCGNGFGSGSEGRLVLDATVYDGRKVYLSAAEFNHPIEIWENTSTSQHGQQMLNGETTTRMSENRINGSVTLHSNYTRLIAPSYCDMIWAGGLFTKDMLQGGFVLLGYGRHIITGTPMNITGWTSDTVGNVVLEVAGNKVGYISLSNSSRSQASLRLSVDNAVVDCNDITLHGGATVYLDGHNLETKQLFANERSGDTIKSDKPAVLHVTDQKSDCNMYASFYGEASLRKGGTGILTIVENSSTKGTLQLDSGKIVFGENGSWPNASKAIIAGGTLELAAGEAFGLNTELTFPAGSTGVLQLDGDVTRHVGEMRLGNGELAKHGIWGAVGNSKAKYTTPSITGTGLLRVGARRGMAMIVDPESVERPPVFNVAAGTDLVEVRDEVRAWRNGKKSRANAKVKIVLAAGRYEVSEPIELSAEDSYTEWMAEEGAEVRISGGKLISAAPGAVSDASIANLLPTASRSKVVEYDIGQLGLSDYGDYLYNYEYHISSRFNTSWNQPEFIEGAFAPPEDSSIVGRLDLFFNDELMQVARTPSNEWYHIERLSDGSPETSAAGNFTYKEDRPSNWVNEPDPHACGCWCHDWAQQHQRIEKLDPVTKTIELSKPYHQYNYKVGMYFYGFNLVSELDEPGEWFLNRKTGKLLFYPPASTSGARLEITSASRLFNLSGASDIVFRGMIFEGCRNSAFCMNDCRRCVVRDSTIRNLGQHCVIIEDGFECGASGCKMYGMGGGGVWMADYNAATLVPSGHYTENCDIHDYGRWDRMYRAAVSLGGVGIRAIGNKFHDAPHSAVQHYGCDLRIESNEVYRVCHSANDCGAMYTGRNWFHRGSVIRGNYIHDIIGLNNAYTRTIYLDDSFGAIKIIDNRFERCTWAIFLGGGRDNVITGNTFYDCPRALQIDCRGMGWQYDHVEGRIYSCKLDQKHLSEPYVSRYPELVHLLDGNPHAPENNVITGNKFIRGDATWIKKYGGTGLDKTGDWWKTIENENYVRGLNNLDGNVIDNSTLPQ